KYCSIIFNILSNMINWKVFIIFFIILTHFICETRFLLHRRILGVAGRHSNGMVLVTISKSRTLQEKRPVAQKLVKEGVKFHLFVTTFSRRRFSLKIYHSCFYASNVCKSVTVLSIPTKFVVKQQNQDQFFNLGSVSLKDEQSYPLPSTKKNKKQIWKIWQINKLTSLIFIFIIFFIILTHFIFENKFILHKRKFGVICKLTCWSSNQKLLKVTLSKNSNSLERNPLAKSFVKVGTKFHISAGAFSLKPFSTYMKIYHCCFESRFKSRCPGVTIVKIPSHYLIKTWRLKTYYVLKNLDLSKQKTQIIFKDDKKNNKTYFLLENQKRLVVKNFSYKKKFFNMMYGIILLIFLNILIHFNSGIHFLPRKQIVGVSGNFTCKYRSFSFVTVTLSKHGYGYTKEEHPLAKTRIKVGSPFHLIAKSSSYKKFDVYIKIYHNCFPSKLDLCGLSIKRVPAKFIYKKMQLCEFYSLGNVRLDHLPAKHYSCSQNKKKCNYLIIYIYIICFEVKCMFSRKVVGVAGTINCKYSRIGMALVTISKSKRVSYSGPLAKIKVKFGNPFHLMAKTLIYNLPVIKIYHNCFHFKPICQGVVIKHIPKNFIYKKLKALDFFNVGKINLDQEETKVLPPPYNKKRCFLR
uniref:Uncharacterized protein n=1 Tax=Strongyloides stercoralis TaxID=6248 RepID=A0AAF5CZH3_STRER